MAFEPTGTGSIGGLRDHRMQCQKKNLYENDTFFMVKEMVCLKYQRSIINKII